MNSKYDFKIRLPLFINRVSQTQSMNLWLLEGRIPGGRDREFGKDIYTLLYLKQITNKDLVQSTGNSAPCYVAAWMEGDFREEWILS